MKSTVWGSTAPWISRMTSRAVLSGVTVTKLRVMRPPADLGEYCRRAWMSAALSVSTLVMTFFSLWRGRWSMMAATALSGMRSMTAPSLSSPMRSTSSILYCWGMAASTWAAISASSSSKTRMRFSKSTSSSISARSTGWIDPSTVRRVSRLRPSCSRSSDRFGSESAMSGRFRGEVQERRDQEIYGRPEQIVKHRHERAAGNGRVLLEPVKEHRPQGAAERGRNRRGDHGQEDRDADLEHVRVALRDHHRDEGGGEPAGQAEKRSELELGDDDLEELRHPDAAHAQAADDQRRALEADVAARRGDRRHERGQHRRLLEGRAEDFRDHDRDDQLARERAQQPGQAAGVPLQRRRLQRVHVDRAGHLVHVRAGLAVDHVDDVLQGDDAQHPALLVHDGHRPDAVLLREQRDVVFRGLRPDGGDILPHERADGLVRLMDHQARERADPQQVFVRVDDVDEIDRVRVHAA